MPACSEAINYYEVQDKDSEEMGSSTQHLYCREAFFLRHSRFFQTETVGSWKLPRTEHREGSGVVVNL